MQPFIMHPDTAFKAIWKLAANEWSGFRFMVYGFGFKVLAFWFKV